MTVIVGLIDGDRVVMGADTAAANPGSIIPSASKLIRREGWLFGVSGSSLLSQYLRVGPLPEDATTEAIYALADRWFFWCRDRDRVEEGHLPGAALIAHTTGKLWRLQADGSVLEAPSFAIIGAGEDLALGALASLLTFSEAGLFVNGFSNGRLPAQTVVQTAIKTAITHNPFCGGEAEVVIWPPQE